MMKIYELINGNWKVKEYDEKGRVIFEGEYKNGKRWNGIVKKYETKGGLPSENIYLNDEKIHQNGYYLNREYVDSNSSESH